MIEISSIAGIPRQFDAPPHASIGVWVSRLRQELEDFVPFDLFESRYCDLLARLISQNSQAFDANSYIPGHVTASGIVINSRQELLMIFHSKLKRWLQPGGHVEDCDFSLRDSASREVLEETNVSIDAAQGELFDVDIHWIPDRLDTPGHYHFDCRYFFRCADQSAEAATDAEKAGWISIAKARRGQNDPGLERVFRKLKN